MAAFAPLLSDAPIIILCLLILSRVPASFVQLLQIIGGLYLIYLAVEAFKTFGNYDPQRVLQTSGHETLFKAVTVNLLNPNPYLAWSLVMGPLLLKAWQEAPIDGIVLLIGFYVTMLVGLVGTILLFSALKSLGTKINRILIGVSGVALGGFGLFELGSGIKALL